MIGERILVTREQFVIAGFRLATPGLRLLGLAGVAQDAGELGRVIGIVGCERQRPMPFARRSPADLAQLPPPMRRSLTWDRGREMAEHQELTAELGIDVYFCDPRSPWQRGSNENPNRLLRQYLARGADLRASSIRDLDDAAKLINTRPRRVLDWATSAELFWPQVRAEYVS